MKELVADCANFVDVGANEGVFIFTCRSFCSDGTEIHWFEPDRYIHDRLAKNLRINRIDTFGNRAAIAASSGAADFYRNMTDDLLVSSTDQFTHKHETVLDKVETIRLDEYFRGRGIRNALVKIDVEGAGCGAWAGASEAKGEIKYLVMEMLEPEIRQGLPARIIAEGSFHAYYLKDFELLESPDGQFDYVDPFWNWLFCKLDPVHLTGRLSRTKFRVVNKGAALRAECRCLALVSDAFGGRGGIAQYNRDFLSALASSRLSGDTTSSITVLPRRVPDDVITPTGIEQMSARTGRIAYALSAIGAALTRRVNLVFCGHLYMASLAALIARLKGANLIVQVHGIEAWPRP